MFRKFLRDENGQATTEYILILSIAVGFAVIVIKNLIKPFYEKLKETLQRRFDEALFQGDLHRLPLGR